MIAAENGSPNVPSIDVMEMTGASCGAIRNSTVFAWPTPRQFVAVNVTLNVPLAVGVPEILPFESSRRPGGRPGPE